MPPSTVRPPGALYSRTVEFLRFIQDDPAGAVEVQGVIVGLTSHLTGVVDYPSWEAFKEGLVHELPALGSRVAEWGELAFRDGDPLAGWAYELVGINLQAHGTPDPAAVSALDLTSGIIRKAIADANPFDHAEPVPEHGK
ncbi:MAG: hypothetical protein HQL33_11625 [Alphaproteobacteria bacterium]|nr:hypothetical protein [Alphaproteobacteria bacterium]